MHIYCMIFLDILRHHSHYLRLKCVEQKMWENSTLLVRQVEKIGAKYAAALVEAGMTSIFRNF